MSTSVGELFVDLGVKGSDKTIGAISGIKTGMGDVASMSLEAKAAIVGAMYAFEKMMAASSQKGTNLTNMTSLLGLSAKELQQYEYAARQVGLSNEEMDNTFKTLESTVAKTRMNQGAPKWLSAVTQATGMTMKEYMDSEFHPEILLKRLQQYAMIEKDAARRNEVLGSFGISEGMKSVLPRNPFRPEVLNRAPLLTDGQVASLDKANIAWSNLGAKIERVFELFNAKHGNQLVNDLTKIVDKMVPLIERLTTLIEKMHVFQGLGHAFDALAGILGLITVGVDKASGQPVDKDKKAYQEAAKSFMEGMGIKENAPNNGADVNIPMVPGLGPMKEYIKPPMAPPAPSSTNIHNNTVNQNFQHDGKDHEKHKKATKDGIQAAYRVSPQGRIA